MSSQNTYITSEFVELVVDPIKQALDDMSQFAASFAAENRELVSNPGDMGFICQLIPTFSEHGWTPRIPRTFIL